jgi:hypothetical protein
MTEEQDRMIREFDEIWAKQDWLEMSETEKILSGLSPGKPSKRDDMYKDFRDGCILCKLSHDTCSDRQSCAICRVTDLFISYG